MLQHVYRKQASVSMLPDTYIGFCVFRHARSETPMPSSKMQAQLCLVSPPIAQRRMQPLQRRSACHTLCYLTRARSYER